jgi:hypothetical protein
LPRIRKIKNEGISMAHHNRRTATSRSATAHASIRGVLHLSAVAASLLVTRSAFATARVWLDTDGLFWSNTAGWQGGVVPVSGDTVSVGTLNGGTSSPTLNYSSTYTGVGLSSLDINSTGLTGTVTFSQSLGTMIANTEIVGDTIAGNVYSQNGGTNTVANLTLGNQVGGAGTYSLSGSGIVNAGILVVGASGSGGFTQSGGNVTITNFLAVGGNNGLYTLSGGNLTINGGYAVIGAVAHAAFNQTGGTFNLGGSPFYLDGSTTSGANTTYSLSGTGSIISADYEGVGSPGAGSALFTQSGGTNSFQAGGTLALGENGSATYTLSNGTLASWNVIVGDSGASTFNQSGGNHTSTGTLTIGFAANGIYNLTGGSLTAANEVIGSANETTNSAGNGTFNQNNGTHFVSGNVTLGYVNASNGAYNLTAGNFTIGTTATPGALLIGNGGSGSYFQQGGNLSLPGGYIGLSNYNGGGGGSGTAEIEGGSVVATTIELGSSGGSVSDFELSNGSINVAHLEIATSSASNGTFVLDTGSGPSATLTVGNEYVAYSGAGAFNQYAGNHTVTGTLTLAQGTGGVAKYYLQTGTLSAFALVDGGYGTAAITQVGGIVTIGAGGAVINETGSTLLPSSYGLYAGAITSPNSPGGFVINPGGSFTENQAYGFSNQTGYINNYGNFTYTAGIFNGTLENDLTGTVTITTGSLFTANAGILNKGSITLLANTTIASGSAATLDNEDNLALAGGTIAGAGQIINNGLLFGFGTIAGTDGFTNNNYLSAVNGNILFSTAGTNTNAGTIALTAGHQFQLNGVTLTNNGTFSLANGLLNGTGSFSNAAPGSLVGPGTITAPFTNTGSVSPGAGTLLITTSWTNNGSIQPTGVGSQLTGGLILNNASIQGAGTIAAAVTNNGTIEATGGVLIFTAALTNSSTGTLRASPNNKILIQGANFPTNAGLIDLAGGTFDNGGQPLNNTGTITGFGVFSTGGAGLTNNANITFTGGTATINGNVTNNANHTLNVKYQPALFTGNVLNNANATIKTTNTTATFTGTFTNNGSYLSDPSTNIFSSLTNNGTMSGGSGDVYTFTPGAGFSNGGTFTNGGALNASANLTNAGTFTQTGPQSWSSTAGFTNTAGTASFGSNAKLAFLTITGGTVDTTTSLFIVEPTNKSATLAAIEADAANHSLLSSTLPAHTALAVIDNATLPTPFTTFGGMPADTNSILIAPELLGDTNIDGTVNVADLNTVLANLGATQSNWTKGNFDDAATIDLTDLNDVLNNLGQTYANSSAAQPSAPTPEPGSLWLWVAGVVLVSGVRRRGLRSTQPTA